MSVWFIPPYTPFLYSETGVYRGIHVFLIFALKHRLWVLVRTASVNLKIIVFIAVKNCSILHGHVFVMISAGKIDKGTDTVLTVLSHFPLIIVSVYQIRRLLAVWNFNICKLSLVMRKPTFCIFENKDADQLRSKCAADQRLCFCYMYSIIPLLHKSEISRL